LFRTRDNGGGKHFLILKFRRERSGKLDSRHVQNLADGLNRELRVASGDHGDGLGPATWDLYLNLAGDTEPVKDLGEPGCGAASHRDRLRTQ